MNITITKPAVVRWDSPRNAAERLDLIERAARVCYKSEDSVSAEHKVIAQCIASGHESVLEHGEMVLRPAALDYLWMRKHLMTPFMLRRDGIIGGNIRAWRDALKLCKLPIPYALATVLRQNGILFGDIPFKSEGNTGLVCEELFGEDVPANFRRHVLLIRTDRGVTHELVRHRVMSFSQESTRYCNYSKDKFGGKVTVIQPDYCDDGSALYGAWLLGCETAAGTYFDLLNKGATAQEARCVLPTCTKADIVMSGNMAEWSCFLFLRDARDAHPDMQKVARMIGRCLLLD